LDYNDLGKTGLKVSRVGFGGIPVQRNSPEEAAGIIGRALELGVNFIDSARAYTDSETKIGRAIRGKRDKVILATKSMARTEADMRQEIETSLREFGTDYIDLYQCHNVRDNESLDKIVGPGGAYTALEEARRAGKIGHIGITSHRTPILVEAMRTAMFETVQFPFNFMEREPEKEFLGLAQENGLGIIIMKPLAGGAIRHVAPALKFILGFNISTVIPGMDSLEQVDANVAAAAAGAVLSPGEMALLEEEAGQLGQTFCRRCEYCMPCPAGVQIPIIFICDGYYERYGLPDWAKDKYRDMSVHADACQDCAQCEERCPYGLPIRQMLARAHEHLG